MKIRTFFPLLLLSSALLCQCQHTRYTFDKLPDEYLRFGSGGGFTGAVTEYTLLENGQLFKFDSKAPAAVEQTGTKRRRADKLTDQAEALGLLDLKFEHPGNLYYFIEFQDEGRKGRVTWGDPRQPVDPKIQALYDQLIQLTLEKQ